MKKIPRIKHRPSSLIETMTRKRMIEQGIERAGISPLAARLGAWANRLPLPWERWPVRVDGMRMCAHTLDRFIALWLWETGKLERAESRVLEAFSFPGMCALDIGANIGVHTLRLARAAGPAGRVWAWEPEPENARMLEKNVRANGFSNVEVIRAAAGEEDGRGTLWVSASHHGDHRLATSRAAAGPPLSHEISVPVRRVDHLVPESCVISLIKMDIQGAEGLALRGLRRILEGTHRMAILMEVTPDRWQAAGTPVEEVLAGLEAQGFRLHTVGGDGLLSPASLSVREIPSGIPARRYANILALRGDAPEGLMRTDAR